MKRAFTKRKKREQAVKPVAPPVPPAEQPKPAEEPARECPDGGYHEDSSCTFCDK